MRKTVLLCLLGAALLAVSGCEYNQIEVNSASESDDATVSESDDATVSESGSAEAVITLSENGADVSGKGAKVKGNQVQITKAGTYTISGTASDVQLYVESSDEGAVTLIFDGVSLTNESENALHVEQADEVILELAEGSDNLLQSGTSLPERAEDDASGGALFTRDDLTITGDGSLTVNGYLNDGIHANDDVTIESGDLVISAADDGIHANEELTIKGGSLTVTDSYEGIEGNRIHIKGGTFDITSSDDGINAYGGQNNFGFGGRGATSANTTEETPELIIDDGEIYVNAGGDGLDSNGDLIVNGGYIVVDGPTSSANGAIDSGMENGGACEVHGGTVLAIGASGMAETFGSSSTQDSFRVKMSAQEAGTEIVIKDADGNELFSHTSAKSFSSIVFSSPDLQTGEDYTVTAGGKAVTFTQDETSTTITTEEAGSGSGTRSGAGGRGGTNPGARGGASTSAGAAPDADTDAPADAGTEKPADAGTERPDDAGTERPDDAGADEPPDIGGDADAGTPPDAGGDAGANAGPDADTPLEPQNGAPQERS